MTGTQSCQNHLTVPVKMVVCISCLGFSVVLMMVVFPGNGCWLMVAFLVLRIWLADLLVRCQEFRSVLGSIRELLCMCCRVLAFVLIGGETCLFGELLIPIMHQ